MHSKQCELGVAKPRNHWQPSLLVNSLPQVLSLALQAVCQWFLGTRNAFSSTDLGQVLLTAPTLLSAASRKTKASPQDMDVSSSIVPPEEALKIDFYSHKERSQSAEMNTGTPLDSIEADHYLVGLC